MIEILQVAGSLGVGAFLGAVIFFMYRRDRRCSEKTLTHLLDADRQTREGNTRALTELTGCIKALNGNLAKRL